jgi:hypothetical protein
MIDETNSTPNVAHEMSSIGKLLAFLWVALKHPITGVLAAILVGVVTYFLSRTTKEPVFIVSPPELMAQSTREQKQLKIFWEDKEIQNAASVEIAFWNAGSQFIDSHDISSTEPIRIIPSEKVTILAVNLLGSSRPSLAFDYTKEIDSGEFESAVITIRGDEALEHFDGAIFHLLYSGKLDTKWKVIGRVKGSFVGFQEKDWTRSHRQLRPHQGAYSLAALSFVLAGSIFFTISGIRRHADSHSHMRWAIIVVLWGYFLFAAVFLFVTEYYYLLAPAWVSSQH